MGSECVDSALEFVHCTQCAIILQLLVLIKVHLLVCFIGVCFCFACVLYRSLLLLCLCFNSAFACALLVL